jgi:hypothetical protein
MKSKCGPIGEAGFPFEKQRGPEPDTQGLDGREFVHSMRITTQPIQVERWVQRTGSGL